MKRAVFSGGPWNHRLKMSKKFTPALAWHITLGKFFIENDGVRPWGSRQDAGIERTRRQDAMKASEIELWADQLAGAYQILAVDTQCFREWGRIMDRRPDRFLEDAMIAATARVHDLIVATRSEGDFKQLGVRVVNPFKTS